MMAGQVPPPGWFQVCPRCATVVDYTCSCPGGWGSPAVPDDVETLHFDDLDAATQAANRLRALNLNETRHAE